MNKIIDAWNWAQHIHEKEKRHGGDPYITHPLMTATILLRHGYMDENLITAAILHDVIESSSGEPKNFSGVFGRKIAGIVKEVSKVNGKFRLESKEAHLIKMADRIHNLSTCPEWMLKKYIGKTERLIQEHGDGFKGADAELYASLLKELDMTRKRLKEEEDLNQEWKDDPPTQLGHELSMIGKKRKI